ncbi:MAG: hypothetical protein ACEPOV_14860 [Hyphomicrobiales bacterium]
MKPLYSKMIAFVAAFLLIISGSNLFSQTFLLNGESRTRGYYAHGLGSLPPKDVNPATFIEQRTRLNFDFKRNKLEYFFGLEDKRYWGQEGNPTKDIDANLGVYAAYVKYRFMNNVDVQFGRQIIFYDDERLFTSGEWTAFNRSFDLAKFHIVNPRTKAYLDIGLGASASKSSAYITDFREDVAKYIGYTYYNQKFFDQKLNISLYTVMNGLQGRRYQGNDTTHLPNTLYVNELVGIFSNYTTNNFQFEAEFYYEFGKTQDGKKLSATFYAGAASYLIGDSLILTLGYERNSGSDLSNPDFANRSTSFVNTYGQGNEYLGALCYFNDGTSTNYAGLQDVYFDGQYSPVRNFWINPQVHCFLLTHNYVTPTKKVNKYLGMEVDMELIYHPYPDFTLSVLGGYLFQTSSFNAIPNIGVPNDAPGGTPYFVRLEVLFSPNIFTHTFKKKKM